MISEIAHGIQISNLDESCQRSIWGLVNDCPLPVRDAVALVEWLIPQYRSPVTAQASQFVPAFTPPPEVAAAPSRLD